MDRHFPRALFFEGSSLAGCAQPPALKLLLKGHAPSATGIIPCIMCVLLLCSCGSIDSGSRLQSPDPNTRMDALIKAGNGSDESVVPNLVPALQSEDPLVRWAAQQSLEKITGTTLGYGWSDHPTKRAQATQKWVLWCKEKNLSTTNAS